MEKLRSIIGFLGMLAILFLCNAGLGFLVFAEGVELLSIGGPETGQATAPAPPPAGLRWRATKPQLVHAGESVHRYAARPCMVRLKDGTLLTSLEWNAGEEASTVLFIESLDGGKSWSKPFEAKVPIDHADGGVMGLMNDGRILMACDQAHGSNLGVVKNRSGKPLPKLIKKTGRRPDGKETEAYENYRYYSDTWITFSSDRGRTWSAGRKVEHETLMGSSLWTGARPAELADGTMVIPIDGYLSSDDMDGIWLSSGVLRSSDRGGTWKFSVVGQTDRKQGMVFSEPAMAELRDGRLVFMMRTQNRVIEEDQIPEEFRSGLYRSVSSDGGRTWSTPVRVLTGTHCSITQLGNGQLLCGWHRPIQYALSSDAGKSWTKPEPWFLGRDSHQGWYTNVEFYDDETAVAMLKDYGPHPNWIWACRLALVMNDPTEQTAARDGFPVGKSRADQERNALLLSDYKYEWKIAGMAGYSGQDLQRIHTIDTAGQAIRTRVGGRGNYKAGMARLEDGRVVLAVCQQHKDYYTNPKNRTFSMVVYESPDSGRTWREIARPSIHAKEPSLTVTADGALLLTAQDFRLNGKRNEMWVCRSTDGGRTWDKALIPGRSYPRNVVVEQDGTLLFLRSKGAEKFELCRSGDHGKTWTFSEGLIDWRPEDISAFSEVSVLRLKSGNLLAALRHRRPVARSGAAPRGHRGHALARTMVTVSGDDGKTWSTPRPLTNTGEVHGNLLQLKDGRIMASYVNYHQPFGVCVVLSHDEGKTWNTDRRVQLSFSAVTATGNNGWPVSLELGDDRFLTCFANNAYPYDDPPTVTCETVQWKLPPSMQPTQLRSKK